MKKIISKKDAYKLVKNFDKHGALLGFGFGEGENRIKGKYESHDFMFNETYLGIRKAVGSYLNFLLAAKPEDYSVSDSDFCIFFGFTLDEINKVRGSDVILTQRLNHSFYDRLIKKYKKCTYPKAIKAIDTYGKINFGISDDHDKAFKLMLKNIKSYIKAYKNVLKENSKFPLDFCDDDDMWVSSYKDLFTLDFVWTKKQDKRSKECSEGGSNSWDGFTDEERARNNSIDNGGYSSSSDSSNYKGYGDDYNSSDNYGGYTKDDAPWGWRDS